jgi:folate-binding protein YgfZ
MPAMTTIDHQRRAADEAALIHARPDLAALIVTGKDRQTWLNGLVTCELAGKKPGEGVYGLAVGKTGKIAAEIAALLVEDHLALVLPSDRIDSLLSHLERHLIMEDAELASAEGRAVFAVHGPRAGDLVAFARASGADAAMVDFTGRGDAALILAPAGDPAAFADALLAAAGEGAAMATPEGWEALRVAWGVPRFGVDFDDQTLPQEASLERLAVSFNKGCYLGQETVFMLEKRGHAKKRLMRLAIDTLEADALAPGVEIVLPEGGASIGTLTSVTPSAAGGAIGLGYVKFKHATEGAALLVGGRPARALGLAASPQGREV